MKYLVLVTDEEKRWWFELEEQSWTDAKHSAIERLKSSTGKAEIVITLKREPIEINYPGVDLTSVTLVVDGSCHQNPGPGGWAAILIAEGIEVMRSGNEQHTTNNRMELMALLQGLRMLPEPAKVRVILDSRYVLDPFDKGWLKTWQKNGWKTAGKEPVKNQDLWELLEQEIQKHAVTWEWVKGHSGHPLNEKVDAEANRQASKIGVT